MVFGWADSPLAQAADLALPTATHAERDGTFVNVERRLQRFERAFPPPGQARAGIEVWGELLARFEPEWEGLSTAAVFALLANAVPAFAGLSYAELPATGAPLAGAPPAAGAADDEVRV